MLQIGRTSIVKESGALASKRYLIIDRDTKYTAAFRALLIDAGTQVIRLPPRSPNLNAHAERFVRTIKTECLRKIIFVGQASLRRAASEFVLPYHQERNHHGLDKKLLYENPTEAANDANIRRLRPLYRDRRFARQPSCRQLTVLAEPPVRY